MTLPAIKGDAEAILALARGRIPKADRQKIRDLAKSIQAHVKAILSAPEPEPEPVLPEDLERDLLFIRDNCAAAAVVADSYLPEGPEPPSEPLEPGPGPEPPGPVPEPPAPSHGFSEADLAAVDALRQAERVQLVPRTGRGGWRVDGRTLSKEHLKGEPQPTIAEALADSQRRYGAKFPGIPPGDAARVTTGEIGALVRLRDELGLTGACSARWESNGTHADHNWSEPGFTGEESLKWSTRGLLIEPVNWLAAEKARYGR